MTEIELLDPPCTVQVRTRATARRFTLRLSPSGDGAVLTQPPGVAASDTQAFLTEHAGWLRRALERQPEVVTVRHGARLPVDGTAYIVDVQDGPRRAPMLEDHRLVLRGAGNEGRRIAQWLKLRARDRLAPAVKHYAAQLDRHVARVALRDTRSRWGSCSTTGTVSFSWRLAMAPVDVQEYVAAHEAAHLVEMNHSPRYWAVVARLMPDWKPRRDWLRRHGRELHLYRFD
ncbi:MAG: SprT family zinc-dependent metalloprotease [Pseudomonadota bacterium]